MSRIEEESIILLPDFNDEEIETDEYVKNPINAFHILQRTSQWIPKLQKTIPNLKFNFRSSSFYTFSSSSEKNVHC